jgi:hypothetical protein
MQVHGELKNPSNGQPLRAPVKNSLFKQEDAEKRGMKGRTRQASAVDSPQSCHLTKD